MGLLDGLTLSVSVQGGDSVVVFPDGKIEKCKEDEMGCCGGGCGRKKKDPHLESREVGKLCPVFDAPYLASGPFFKKNSEGPDTTYCAVCGAQEVWAYKPKCHCGATICPNDKYCGYHGHWICTHVPEGEQCDELFHDYAEQFAE